MRCIGAIDYIVTRASTARWWEPPNNYGKIVSIDCAYCEFKVLRRHTGQPRTSKSGIGKYNRMKGRMVKHLHEKHREDMIQTMSLAERKARPRIEC